ncbi:MAG: hypothetical protein CVU39_12290 [Chloroflexi bacterium HGW-Chloroflexi-10]|nr:MAG: hypothetical protein CVU39_12290 [Chloroflexi bacterium HGW-Chloroflexi-10]
MWLAANQNFHIKICFEKAAIILLNKYVFEEVRNLPKQLMLEMAEGYDRLAKTCWTLFRRFLRL